MKHIVHIDLNAFFIQVETLFDSSLNDIPAAVGYNSRRGVISTSNYIARERGVNSGDSVSNALNKCPDLKIVEPHYELYIDYSKKFFNILKEKTNKIEVASIDEAYLDLSEYLNGTKIEEKLFDLQLEIYKRIKLKCSIGCSYTRFFAKMGSDLIKPLGLTIITKDNYKELLFSLDISKIYGLGKKSVAVLKELNINTINELVNTKDEKVISFLGNRYLSIINELNGDSSDELNLDYVPSKSISSERTFISDEEDYDHIIKMIETCTLELVENLTRHNKKTKGVTIKLRFNDFKTLTKKYQLNEPSNSFAYIYQNILNLYDSININKPLRLVGVKFDDFSDNDVIIKKDDDENRLF